MVFSLLQYLNLVLYGSLYVNFLLVLCIMCGDVYMLPHLTVILFLNSFCFSFKIVSVNVSKAQFSETVVDCSLVIIVCDPDFHHLLQSHLKLESRCFLLHFVLLFRSIIFILFCSSSLLWNLLSYLCCTFSTFQPNWFIYLIYAWHSQVCLIFLLPEHNL